MASDNVSCRITLWCQPNGGVDGVNGDWFTGHITIGQDGEATLTLLGQVVSLDPQVRDALARQVYARPSSPVPAADPPGRT